MYNILLSGGGIDSNALSFYLKTKKWAVGEFDILHIDYGQDNYVSELEAIQYFCEKYNLTLLKCPVKMNAKYWAPNCSLFGITPEGQDEKTIRGFTLESRNLILISIAVSIVASKGGGVVYVGFHVEPDNLMPDTSPKFLSYMNDVAYASTYAPAGIVIRAPFLDFGWTKNEIMNYVLENDGEILTKSHYCHNKVRCSVCDKCKQVDFFLDGKTVG